MASAGRRTFFKNWYSPEVIPIYAVMGIAIGGASWYLTRLARGPEVIWDKKSNPYPWQNIDQDTNVKLMAVNKEFAKTYKRDKW